ncbi:MAG: [Fe-Fe] hydrogenase large subunit C-terminal domain-containing protein [Melioribacteraceae bacterium]|nr:[Fe-Fe] hydrogenase large subunit C-terminal domain-containing protein [Melioribacteraceae bacterium]
MQIAPAVRASLAENPILPICSNVTGQIITGLRILGFKDVFDTKLCSGFNNLVEEAAELVNRVQNGKTLPMFTSCCPGWVKYLEQNRPELLDHVSSCKSPHEMEGAVLKSYYAKKMGIDPKMFL